MGSFWGGTIVVIDAPSPENSNMPGNVRASKIDGSDWDRWGQYMVDNLTGEGRSGFSVDLSADGMTPAVGSPLNDLSSMFYNSGKIQVYKYKWNVNASSWHRQGQGYLGKKQLGKNLDVQTNHFLLLRQIVQIYSSFYHPTHSLGLVQWH